MSGASTTTLNPGTAGDTIIDELIGADKMPVSKIYTGALGVNGGAVTAANPFPVSDVNLPTVGIKTAALSSPVVNAVANYDKASTIATTGKIIKASAGAALYYQVENTSGGAVFAQIHDLASGSPAGGARPVYYGASIGNSASLSAAVGQNVYGVPCPAGVCLIFSSTAATYTAIASTSIAYTLYFL
jgi:hypothetical protein